VAAGRYESVQAWQCRARQSGTIEDGADVVAENLVQALARRARRQLRQLAQAGCARPTPNPASAVAGNKAMTLSREHAVLNHLCRGFACSIMARYITSPGVCYVQSTRGVLTAHHVWQLFIWHGCTSTQRSTLPAGNHARPEAGPGEN